jgi:transcription factor SFP1
MVSTIFVARIMSHLISNMRHACLGLVLTFHSIIMTGTSPFPYQSPSYHSSSYLPKLEANFMRDFSCCGHTLPTLHDLLQHYEECHAQQTPQSLRTATQQQLARDQQQPNNKAAIASQAATSVQQQAQQRQQQQQQQQQHQQLNRSQNGGFGTNKPTGGISSLTGGIQQMRQQQSQPATPTQKTVQPSMDDMDGVNDMEMDDAIGPMDSVDTPTANNQRPVQPAQQSMFGQQQRQNNLTNTGGILHQGLRTSQPSTPSASGFGFQNNPTVSSVNTPTLSAQPQQNNARFSPDNSIPGTPSEMDEDFSTMNMDMNNLGNMNMNNMNNMNFPYGFGNDLGLDLCIDEPAKRLFSPNGGLGNQRALQQQFAQFGLGNGQFGNNDDLVRRLRQQQMMQMQGYGNASAAMMMAGEEHKPFRCPVIGCEKAYKNQNGLK